MPRQQQKRQGESSQPSSSSKPIPLSAIKFTKSTSAQGRLAFVDLVINEHTFHLFDGLKVCSFVVLKPKERGGSRRVYVPGHKLPNGQSFQHVQEAGGNGDLAALREAILNAYDDKFGAPSASDQAGADDDGLHDTEPLSEDDMPF